MSQTTVVVDIVIIVVVLGIIQVRVDGIFIFLLIVIAAIKGSHALALALGSRAAGRGRLVPRGLLQGQHQTTALHALRLGSDSLVQHAVDLDSAELTKIAVGAPLHQDTFKVGIVIALFFFVEVSRSVRLAISLLLLLQLGRRSGHLLTVHLLLSLCGSLCLCRLAGLLWLALSLRMLGLLALEGVYRACSAHAVLSLELLGGSVGGNVVLLTGTVEGLVLLLRLCTGLLLDGDIGLRLDARLLLDAILGGRTGLARWLSSVLQGYLRLEARLGMSRR